MADAHMQESQPVCKSSIHWFSILANMTLTRPYVTTAHIDQMSCMILHANECQGEMHQGAKDKLGNCSVTADYAAE